MTAPTQPPDPRVQRIADALCAYDVREMNATEAARVLVEELGGRGAPVMPMHSEYVRHERRLFDALTKYMPPVPVTDDLIGDAVKALEYLYVSLNACRAQQWENGDTIKALKERAETAEAANTELDNARKSAEQSARDLRENNATLRAELDAKSKSTEFDQELMDKQAIQIVDLEAELDAIKGAQVPVIDVFCKNNVCMFGSSTFPSTLPDGVHTLYRHPAPALPVVGACVVGVLTAKTDEVTNCTSFHIDTSKHIPSKIVPPDGEYDIWLGAPLPTEGGK